MTRQQGRLLLENGLNRASGPWPEAIALALALPAGMPHHARPRFSFLLESLDSQATEHDRKRSVSR